jgi:hypothetical protein
MSIITYKVKWLKTNIPQNAEHGYQRTVAPPSGGLDSAHASPQTAPSGSVHVQETQPIMKNDILTTTEFNDIFHLN